MADKGRMIVGLLCVILFGMWAMPGDAEVFSFSYEDFTLNDTFTNIYWNRPDSCNGIVSYKLLKALRGNVTNANDPCNIEDTKFSINNSFLEIMINDRYKFYVNACCNGLEVISDFSLEFPAEVRTVKFPVDPRNDVCLEPQGYALTVIWPRTNNSNDGNCECNLWFTIKQCSCISTENYFGVYNRFSGRETQICWKNVTNHTRVHFVVESTNPYDFSNPLPIPVINREFFLSYEYILAEIPSQPIVEVDECDNSSCLCLSNIYDGNAEVTQYNVIVVNNIKSNFTYNQEKSAAVTCNIIPLEDSKFLDVACHPIVVIVGSTNFIGNSEQTRRAIMNSSSNSDECECFKLNVNTSSNIMNISNSQFLFLEVSCFTQYFQASEILIKINLKRSSVVVDSMTATCNDSIRFDSVKSSTKYEIELKWVSQEGKDCLISEPLVYNTPTASSNSVTIALIVVMSVGVPLFILSLITIIILIVHRRNKPVFGTNNANFDRPQ